MEISEIVVYKPAAGLGKNPGRKNPGTGIHVIDHYQSVLSSRRGNTSQLLHYSTQLYPLQGEYIDIIIIIMRSPPIANGSVGQLNNNLRARVN